jgi:hypothetical protein
MPSRWPIVVGIAVIAGGVAWFALRDGEGEKPTTPISPKSPGSADLTTPSKVVSVPAPPRLPSADTKNPALPKLTAAEVFAAQPRDDEWAPPTETEIRKRFKRVRGAKLSELDCRQSQCQIIVAGTQADVSRTIADLEGDRGLHGFAQNLLLTAPERKPDGTLVLRAFAMFDR